MTTFKWLASFAVSATMVPALSARTHCPGNATSVPLRVLNGYQIVVSVSANRSSPYDFVLDTGTQTTTVDPSLAGELGLSIHGSEEVAGIGFQASASIATLDWLATGAKSVAHQKVLVYPLASFQLKGLGIRGVLGDDFLEHFDTLIDYAHNLLCLDDSPGMRASIKGAHIALVNLARTPEGAPWPPSLIVESRLSDATRPVHLWLDSGTNIPFLYAPFEYLARTTSIQAPQSGMGADRTQRVFVALEAQDVKIGRLELPKISFFTLAGASRNSAMPEFDGVLTMGLFRRVFICHTDHFVILELR